MFVKALVIVSLFTSFAYSADSSTEPVPTTTLASNPGQISFSEKYSFFEPGYLVLNVFNKNGVIQQKVTLRTYSASNVLQNCGLLSIKADQEGKKVGVAVYSNLTRVSCFVSDQN